ncbi:hypothetical protein Tco_0777493 [Tanacetum coccineum]
MKIRRSSRKDDVAVQEKRQRDDDVVHDEIHHQSEEENVEPKRSSRAPPRFYLDPPLALRTLGSWLQAMSQKVLSNHQKYYGTKLTMAPHFVALSLAPQNVVPCRDAMAPTSGLGKTGNGHKVFGWCMAVEAMAQPYVPSV